MMPGMDGWAVLAALKADAATADIPVIMVTIVDDRNLGYALGAADYLTKPIDRERLIAVLARYRPERPILVVDDDPALRELLRRTLEREGYAVVEAADGRSALARIEERVPGLILLDLMMPHMNGFELLTELRARPEWRGIPVVVVTAKDLTPEDEAAPQWSRGAASSPRARWGRRRSSPKCASWWPRLSRAGAAPRARPIVSHRRTASPRRTA